MLKTLIVDDEEKSRITLDHLISTYCADVKVTAHCDSVSSTLKAIEEHNPDLIFLDIEMPFQNGFTLFEKIKEPTFGVVFVTAYDHYAIKAIKYSALDYILKPVDPDELIAAVEKMKQKQASASFRSSDLELLLANLQAKGKSAKIAVPTFDGLQMVHTDEIVRCTAMESCTEISLTNGSRLVVSRILKEYEELLSDLNFFRIHNSYLINLNHVVKYVKGDGGYVLMSDGNHVEVSRRKKGELLNRLSRLRL